MYEKWKIDRVPDGHHVIRLEFQMRREFITEMGVNTFEDLEKALQNVWAHLTQNWLKIQDHADKHHTQQTTRAWWQKVQAGFPGAQDAEPLIRAKAISQDSLRNARQILGFVTSELALSRQDELIEKGEVLDLESHVLMVIDIVRASGMTDDTLTASVKMKQVKSARAQMKLAKSQPLRTALGLSTAPKPEDPPKGNET
jgi:hypothetical protein